MSGLYDGMPTALRHAASRTAPHHSLLSEIIFRVARKDPETKPLHPCGYQASKGGRNASFCFRRRLACGRLSWASHVHLGLAGRSSRRQDNHVRRTLCPGARVDGEAEAVAVGERWLPSLLGQASHQIELVVWPHAGEVCQPVREREEGGDRGDVPDV